MPVPGLASTHAHPWAHAVRRSLALVCGGGGADHALSLASARRLAEALADSERWRTEIVELDEDARWPSPETVARLAIADAVLPLTPSGSALAGRLTASGSSLLGSSSAAVSRALDKPRAKARLADAGLPVLPGLVLGRSAIAAGAAARIAAEIGFPCVVKPACGVASQATTAVHAPAELASALSRASAVHDRVLVEPCVDAREIEIAIVAGEPSLPGELVFRAEIHDLETKSDPQKLELVVPALVDEPTSDRLRALALASAVTLGLEAVARVELFVDRNSHRVTVNEVNPGPSFAPGAPFARLWAASGVGAEELVDRLAMATATR